MATTEWKVYTFRRGCSGKRMSKSTESSHNEARLEKLSAGQTVSGVKFVLFHDEAADTSSQGFSCFANEETLKRARNTFPWAKESFWSSFSLLGNWQLNMKGRPFAFFTFNSYVAMVDHNHILDDFSPEPGSGFLGTNRLRGK